MSNHSAKPPATAAKPRRNRLLRRTLRVAVGIVVTPVLLFMALLALALGFRHDIVDYQLEKVLKTPLIFNDVSVDFTTDFPNTILVLDDVHILGTNPARPNELLKAEEAEVRIDLFKLLTNRTEREVPLIAIRRAELFIEVDENRERNFGLFGRYDPNKKKGPDHVQIESLIFTDLHLVYHNNTMDRQESYQFEKLDTRLNIYRNDLTVELDAKGVCHYIHIGDFSIFENKALRINTKAHIEKKSKLMDFAPSTVQIGAANLAVEGQLLMGDTSYYNLKFKTVGGSLDAIKSLLPSKTAAQIQDFDAMGAMSVVGSFVGYETDITYPHFDLQFRFDDATLRNRLTGFDINGIKLVGSYTNGNQNNTTTTELRLDTLSGTFGDRPFFGRVSLSQFNDLLVDGSFVSKLDIASVSKFFGNRLGDGFSGDVDINLLFDGRISQLTRIDSVDGLHYVGGIKLIDIHAPFLNGGLLLDDLNGEVKMHETSVLINDLSALINGQSVALSGRISDFVPYLIGNKGTLLADIQVNSQGFDVESFIKPLPKEDAALITPMKVEVNPITGKALGKQPKIKPAKAPKPPKGSAEALQQTRKLVQQMLAFSLPDNIDMRLNVNLLNLKYKGLNIEQAGLTLRLNHQKLSCDSLFASTSRDTLIVGFEVLTADKGYNNFAIHSRVGTQNMVMLMQSLNLPTDKLPADFDLRAGFQVDLDGWVEKLADTTCSPAAHFRLSLHDTYFIRKNARIALTNLGFVAYLDERHLYDLKHAPIHLQGIRGTASDYPFAANLYIDNIIDQNANLEVNTDISLPVFLTYFKQVSFIENLDGHLFVNAALKGKLSNFTKFDSLITLSNTGKVLITDTKFRLAANQLEFNDVSASVVYDDELVTLQYLKGQMGGSDVEVSGSMRDVLAYLFQKNAPLIARVNVRSDTLNVKELLFADASKPDSANLKLVLPTHSDLVANLDVNYAVFDRIEVRNLKTRAYVINRLLTLDTLSFQAFEGQVYADGIIDASDTNAITLQGRLDLNNINVRDFFERFNNFGQTFLTDTMMRGVFNGSFVASHTLTSELKPKPADLKLKANVYLTDGALYNFTPLLKLKPLFRKEDLDSLRFGLAIRGANFNGTYLDVPDLQFVSNLVLAQVNGHHFLNNSFTYNVVLHRVAHRNRQEEFEYYNQLTSKLEVSPWQFVLNRAGGSGAKLRVKYNVKNLANMLLP